jgi:hypothetical protein
VQTLAAQQAQMEKMLKSIKSEIGREGTLSVQQRKDIEALIVQMQNPEAVYNARGAISGVPDPVAGAGDAKYTNTTVVDIELSVNSTDGNFNVVVSPDFDRHVAVSGCSAATPTTTSQDGGYVSSYVAPGTADAMDVRKSSSFMPGSGSYVIQKGGGSSNLAKRTIPMIIKFGDLTFVTKETVDPNTGEVGYYIDCASGNTPFTGAATYAAILGGATFEQWTATGQGNLRLVSSGQSPPAFDGSDTTLLTAGNQFLANGGNREFAQASANLTLPTTVKSLYLQITNLTATYDYSLESLYLKFSNANAVTGGAPLPSDGCAYIFPAKKVKPGTWQRVRLVSCSALLQNRSAELVKGGNVVGDLLLLDPTQLATTANYTGISERAFSYAGDLAKGAYGFWLPTNLASWQRWRPVEAPVFTDSVNSIVFAGNAPQVADGGGNIIQTTLHCRVFAVWEVCTSDRQYNPARKSYVPTGVDMGELETAIFMMLGEVPKVTCNPTHEQWTRWLATMKNGALKGAAAVKKYGPYAMKAAGLLSAMILA